MYEFWIRESFAFLLHNTKPLNKRFPQFFDTEVKYNNATDLEGNTVSAYRKSWYHRTHTITKTKGRFTDRPEFQSWRFGWAQKINWSSVRLGVSYDKSRLGLFWNKYANPIVLLDLDLGRVCVGQYKQLDNNQKMIIEEIFNELKPKFDNYTIRRTANYRVWGSYVERFEIMPKCVDSNLKRIEEKADRLKDEKRKVAKQRWESSVFKN